VAEVVDLDVLRPEPKIVKLAGKEIDVSFIPCGITFEVDGLVNELTTYDLDTVQEGGEESKRAFDTALKLCSIFCSHKHPEMTVEWFRDNTGAVQINKLVEIIQGTLLKSYAGTEAYQGN